MLLQERHFLLRALGMESTSMDSSTNNPSQPPACKRALLQSLWLILLLIKLTQMILRVNKKPSPPPILAYFRVFLTFVFFPWVHHRPPLEKQQSSQTCVFAEWPLKDDLSAMQSRMLRHILEYFSSVFHYFWGLSTTTTT